MSRSRPTEKPEACNLLRTDSGGRRRSDFRGRPLQWGQPSVVGSPTGGGAPDGSTFINNSFASATSIKMYSRAWSGVRGSINGLGTRARVRVNLVGSGRKADWQFRQSALITG